MRLQNLFQLALPDGGIARSVTYLVGGTAGAQLVGILCSPIHTRLYSPSDFGILAVYMGIIGVLSSVCCLKYEHAIPLVEDDAEATNLAAICFSLVGIFTFSLFVGIAVFFKHLIHFTKTSESPWILWLVPVGVLSIGSFTVLNLWAVRDKCFGKIAKIKLKQSLVANGMKIAGFKFAEITLLLAFALSTLVGIFNLSRAAITQFNFSNCSLKSVKRSIIRYKRFPLFAAPGAILNTASKSLIPVVLGGLFSAEVAGQYALANQIVLLPMTLIGVSVGQVFLSEAQAAYSNQTLGSLIYKFQSKLIFIAIPIAAVLAIFGPVMFEFVFGSQWRASGEFARYMAPWFLLQFISSPLSMVFSVVSKEHFYTIWQMLLFGMSVIAIICGSHFGDATLAIIFLSSAGVIAYGSLLLWITREAAKHNEGL